MTEFESTVCGIPCIIRVTYWESYRPPYLGGAPENCYPSEGGEGEWEILDRNGRPAPWLEAKMTDSERVDLDDEVFEYMESQND